MIIAINGYIGSGKDTFAFMLQYQLIPHMLRLRHPGNVAFSEIEPSYEDYKSLNNKQLASTGIQIKKFADALKEIAAIMLGIPREKFEDRAFKDSELSEMWWFHRDKTTDHIYRTGEDIPKYAEVELVKPTVRWFLQNLGTEAIRNNIHPNAWVNVLMEQYKEHIQNAHHMSLPFKYYPDWIITDCRFPNEADAVRKAGGLVIRVNAPERTKVEQHNRTCLDCGKGFSFGEGGVHIKCPVCNSYNNAAVLYERHSSETALDNYDFDATIDNSGTPEQLLDIAKRFITYFKLEQYAHTNKRITEEEVSRPFAFS